MVLEHMQSSSTGNLPAHQLLTESNGSPPIPSASSVADVHSGATNNLFISSSNSSPNQKTFRGRSSTLKNPPKVLLRSISKGTLKAIHSLKFTEKESQSNNNTNSITNGTSTNNNAQESLPATSQQPTVQTAISRRMTDSPLQSRSTPMVTGDKELISSNKHVPKLRLSFHERQNSLGADSLSNVGKVGFLNLSTVLPATSGASASHTGQNHTSRRVVASSSLEFRRKSLRLSQRPGPVNDAHSLSMYHAKEKDFRNNPLLATHPFPFVDFDEANLINIIHKDEDAKLKESSNITQSHIVHHLLPVMPSAGYHSWKLEMASLAAKKKGANLSLSQQPGLCLRVAPTSLTLPMGSEKKSEKGSRIKRS